jgi:hypothetical protein
MAEDKKPPISPLLGPDGQPYKGDAAKEQIDDTEKLAAAEKQRLAVMKALNEQGGMNRKQILEINEALDGQLNAYTNLSPEIDAYRAAASSVASTEEELARARGEGNKVLITQLEGIQKANKAKLEELAINQAEGKEIPEGLKQVAKARIENAERLAEQSEQVAKLKFLQDKLTDSTYASGLAINSLTSVLGAAGMESANFTAGGFGLVKQLTDIGLKFDTASKAVEINTGLGKQSSEQMSTLVSENYHLGVSTEEASKALGALNSQYSGFIGLNQDAQTALATTVLELERLGVSAETSGKAMDLLDRGMGLGAEGAEAALQDFDKLAQGLGLPTGQIVEDFTKLGPKLARFGKDGKKQFDLLSKQARSLGVSVEDAFNIAEAFDTFEGAADLAGKLNAQLGLQLNSVEMMKAPHEERIKLLRQEFRQSGKNFDQMHHRQQQAVAEMMGVDVDMASKLFGDPIAYQQHNKDTEEAAARSARLVDVQKKLAAVADRLIVAFGPVLTIFSTIAELLTMGYIPHIIAMVTGVVGAMKTYAAVKLALITVKKLGVVTDKIEATMEMATNVRKKVGIGLDKVRGLIKKRAIVLDTAIIAKEKVMNGLRSVGNLFKSKSLILDTLIAAKMKVMNGLGFIGNLWRGKSLILDTLIAGKAKVMNGLRAISGFWKAKEIIQSGAVTLAKGTEAAADVVLTGTKSTSTGATILNTAATTAGIAPALGFAAAALAVGVAIWLAATGLSSFVAAFAGLDLTQVVGAAASLAGMAVAMYFMIPALATLATTAGVSAAPLFALGVAMIAMGAGVLLAGAGLYLAATGMGNFVASFAGLDITQVLGAALALTGLGASIYFLIPALSSFAASLILGGTGAAIIALNALGAAVLMIGAGLALIAAGAYAAFTGISTVLEAGSTVSPASMKATMEVLDKMIDVQVSSATANVPALTAIAEAVSPEAGGGGGNKAAGGSKKNIELKINERVLGDVIADIMSDRYGLTPK